MAVIAASAQNTAALPPLPAPPGVPKPGPVTDAPYAPMPILQGGVVVPLYPPGSSFLKMERIRGELVMIVADASNPWESRVRLAPVAAHTSKMIGGANDGELLKVDVD